VRHWISAFRWWRKERLEAVQVAIAYALPRWLVYWAFIRIATHQCTGNPADRKCGEALNQWGAK
jgi:hypothetical protein